MKTWSTFSLFLALTISGARGQSPNSGAVGGRPVALLAPAPTPYYVVDTGPHHRIYQQQVFEALPNGQIATNTRSYTELSSGLNYLNTNGLWEASDNRVEAFPGGAIVRHCQHQIIFANNLNSPGTVDNQAQDGKRLRSNVLGLMYSDSTTGQAVQIAQLQDSEGQLISDHEVLYTNAFQGVAADVLYENRIDGMSQDIIIREQLPSAAIYGMNPATTYLAVFTEFLSPPEAEVADVPGGTPDGQPDQVIGWGETTLGQGKAFIIGNQANTTPVSKRYSVTNGRYFLLEKVRLQDIQRALSRLPLHASNVKPLPGMASTHFNFPPAPAAKSAARPMRMALGQAPRKGYVLDYTTLNTGLTNFTFQGDSTYFLSANLNLAGTANVFEGGAVIKFATNTSIVLAPGSALKFSSVPYRPVVFTAKDDNVVGQAISGSTGTPSGYYASPALTLGSMGSLALSEFRVCYANRGLSVSGTSPTIWDAQFVNCAAALSEISGNLSLKNVLLSNIKTNFNSSGSTNSTIWVENATFNNAFDLNSGSFTNTRLYLTNCVFVNVTNLSGNPAAGFNGFYQTPMIGASAVTNTFYPLQQAGAASCYLTNGCSFITNGTAGVDAFDLGLLARKTTWAPVIYSNLTFSVATNFGPQAPRDTNARPTLGWHYDPLDYAFSGVSVYSNVTFSAGTAMGWFELPNSGGAGYGLTIYDKVVLSFNGTASQPCTLARYCTVQEGGDGLWTNLGYLAAVVPQSLSGGYSMSPTNAAVIMPNFTRHALLAEGPNHYRENSALSQVVARNSEFWGGGIGAYWDNLYATNCLFDRVGVGVAGGNPCQYWLRNCALHGGALTLEEFGQTWPVWIEECAFDGTALAVDNNSGGNTNETYCDFNAFVTNANSLCAPGTHNVIVTNYNWQSSWFGNFYLPANSPLINAGSKTADKFGLYQFTTQTNQVKETNSIVDMSYHYVAASTNGSPVISNSNGIPDYLADTNGNGLGPWMPAPVITGQPAGQSVIAGTNVMFSVGANSLVFPNYQWYFNGTNLLVGATNALFSLTNVQPVNAGAYNVIVSNPAGSATSSNAVLTVLVPPTITAQPTNTTVAGGGNAVFTVTATGSAPLSYQWYFDGIKLAAATNALLTVPAAQTTNAGNYTVTITNLAGGVTSTNAVLTVQLAPAIISQPANQVVVAGSNATFSVTATGTAPLGFQWYFNGTTPLTGAQTTTLLATNSIITTVAGNGSTGYTGDGGPAVSAGMNWPDGVAVDAFGNLYIADTYHNVVRKVSTNGIITTVAGNGRAGYTGDGGYATNATLNQTWNVFVDASGNLFIVDGTNNVVRKVNPNGIITSVAGNGTAGYTGNGGPATNATLNQAYDAVADQWGNLFIADFGNNVVRKVNTNGIITTVAGNGTFAYGGDGGVATNASFEGPASVAVDAQGNLYIADNGNCLIRKVNTNGIITSVAGNRSTGYTGDGGMATNASLFWPTGVRLDAAGDIFIADNENSVIREVKTNGIITTVAGNHQVGYSGDGGPATNATLNQPWIATVDAFGRLFIADSYNNVIREVQAVSSVVSTTSTLTLNNVTTNNAGSYSVLVTNLVGGVASTNAWLTVVLPPSITTQPANLMVVQGSNATFNVTATGTAALHYQWYFNGTNGLAGATNSSLMVANAQPAGAGNYSVVVTNSFGLASSWAAGLSVLTWAAATPTDVLGGAANFAVSVSAPGSCSGPFAYQWQHGGTNIGSFINASLIKTVAGNYSQGANYSGDGYAATNATLNGASGTVVDALGNLYIADAGNNVIRKVNANGIITTVAGNNSLGAGIYSGDGYAATNAALSDPSGVAIDAFGDLYIADAGNNVIREVDTNGVITTVAGNNIFGGGYSGDGETATNAALSTPDGVALDAFGNLYIADTGNNVIRKVNTNGVITTVAGNNSIGGSYSGDGYAATNAALFIPNAVAMDAVGNLYIADVGNNVIREVNTNGIITTAAGNNSFVASYSGDGGAATNAALYVPKGVAVDPSGDLYIADCGNNVIREVVPQDNLNIAGGTLAISDASTNDAGAYQVIVSGPCGGVTSSVVTLTVILPPFITTEPTNLMAIQNSNATFSVTAGGAAPLSYQWYFNGASLLPGATNSTLLLTNIQPANAGNYSVIVSNVAGEIGSFNAALMVMSWTVDSDYDGRSDAQEMLDGTDPFNPNSVLPVRLAHFSFYDTNAWMGDAGQLPVATTNIVGMPSWTTNAAQIDSTPLGLASASGISYNFDMTQLMGQSAGGSFALFSVPASSPDTNGAISYQLNLAWGNYGNAWAVLGYDSAGDTVYSTNGSEGDGVFTVTMPAGVNAGGAWYDAGGNFGGSVSALAAPGGGYVFATDTNGNLMAIQQPTGIAVLNYQSVETNGIANINLRCGTIRFWFNPDWTSVSAGGFGPQNQGRLIELGGQGTNCGWWALMLDPGGNTVSFITQTNGAGMTNLTAPISWISNAWHQLALTYSASNSCLFVDGQAVVTNGLAAQFWPSALERSAGFRLGSDVFGNNQTRGTFDDLEMFNYPIDAGSMATDYTNSAAAQFAILAQPNDQVAPVGNNATFSVAAVAALPLGYQWYLNQTTVLGGCTNATIVLTNVQTANAGNYSVKVSSPASNVISAAAVLQVSAQTATTTTSVSSSADPSCVNSSVTFTATVTSQGQPVSSGNVNFYDGATSLGSAVNLNSQGQASLTVKNLSAGAHTITASFAGTAADGGSSGTVTQTVNGITAQPVNQTVCVPGTAATFSVSATGASSYQWQYKTNGGTNFVTISGATGSSYTISAVATNNAGSYECVVNGTCSSQTSAAATLTVNNTPPPSFSASGQPQSQTAATGSFATFTVSATGAASYQWQVNAGGGFKNVTVGGIGTAATYMTPALTIAANGYQYQCVATCAGGCSTVSSAATLTVTNALGDTDGDGLPDAWEELYFGHKGISLTNVDPDGLTVLEDYQLGLNPQINNFTSNSERASYGYTLADWLNVVSGVKTGGVTPDNEGNVQSVSQ